MYSHNNNKPYFVNSFNSIQETNEFLGSPPSNLSVVNNSNNSNVTARLLAPTMEYRSESLPTIQMRPVIPSKRAAQNRAAQKAFRKRREHHIKDLEVKVKQMDNWKQQLDSLRKENMDLKDKMMDLEKQVDTLNSSNKLHNSAIVGVTPFFNPQEYRSVSLPTLNNNNIPPPGRITNKNKRSYSESSARSSSGVEKDSRPLSLSHRTGFNNHLCDIDSSTTHHQLYDNSKRRKTVQQQQSIVGQAPIHMLENNANLILVGHNQETQLFHENEFDPFFHQEEFFAIDGNNEFITTNGGQVLDDLFAMLQTRQRPQIPVLATVASNEDRHDSLNNLI